MTNASSSNPSLPSGQIFSFNPASWPISTKVVAVILAVSLAPMLLTAYYNTTSSLEALRDIELRSQRQIAGNVAGRIGQLLNDTRRTVAYIAAEPILSEAVEKKKDVNYKQVLGRLQKYVAVNPDVDLVIVMDETGTAVVSTEPTTLGGNYKFREYFAQAIKGRPYMTGITIGSVLAQAGVYISHPITNREGVIVGIVVVRVTSKSIGEIVEDERQAKERVGFVIDGDGVVIYHPDQTLRYKSLGPLSAATQATIAADQRFKRAKIDSLALEDLDKVATGTKDAGHVRYLSGPEKTAEIAGFSPVRVNDWTVVVSSPEAYFVAPIQRQFQQVVITVVVVGAVFALLGLLFARSLVRPLNSLINAARALSRGDHEQARAEVYSRDEMGQLAETFNSMSKSVVERERERNIFGALVSPDVRDKLLAGKLQLGGEQIRVAALFSDIRGFSTISEKLSAPDIVAFLNEYLTEMTEAVKPWGGYVNNFIGDAIVVIFGAPLSAPEIEYRAVMAALAMRVRLDALNVRRVEVGEAPLENGIGISTGSVVAGQIGALERCIYTVIGDAVNVAARLEALTKDVGQHILINHATFIGLRHHPEIISVALGEHIVKGRTEPVIVHAIKGVNATMVPTVVLPPVVT